MYGYVDGWAWLWTQRGSRRDVVAELGLRVGAQGVRFSP
jgi:hypothetical protein